MSEHPADPATASGLPSPSLPDRGGALGFWLRVRLLTLWRLIRESTWAYVRRWPVRAALVDAPVLAQVRSPLWTDGRADEFVLVAGKVHNLRVACRAFHSIVIPAGGVMSFWRQLGCPSASRGYVLGREVRQGCVVPTLAGGICQLSNALAMAAFRAGLEIPERHRHSARVEAAGGDVEGLDATVFWRHIDLKLRASHDWRLETELSAEELVVTIRGRAAAPAASGAVIRVMPSREREAPPPVARGCLTCEQTACFRHGRHHGLDGVDQGRVACLLDAWSPEFDAHLPGDADCFVPEPMRLAFWRPRARGWRRPAAHRAYLASLLRAGWQRVWARSEGNGRRQSSLIDGQRLLARAYARALRPQHTHLWIELGLLAHLEQLGVLGGRSYEVLAGTWPMALVQDHLDLGSARWPNAASLRDYRVAPELLAAEQRGLRRALRIHTAHEGVAAYLRGRYPTVPVMQLAWQRPEPRPWPQLPDQRSARPPLLLFPAAGLARKGALDLSAALQGLPCRLRVLGSAARDGEVWRGLDVDWHVAPADPLLGVAAVVLPAYAEQAPRLLLRARAQGLPVIATAACGMGPEAGLSLVPMGDPPALRAALVALLAELAL
ncbi:UNVERIFIED_ORG: VanW family protein [Shinella sp. XGS7]|nr:VanW family protein [Shinella sp. XGS7]